jgi:hypothetical protein
VVALRGRCTIHDLRCGLIAQFRTHERPGLPVPSQRRPLLPLRGLRGTKQQPRSRARSGDIAAQIARRPTSWCSRFREWSGLRDGGKSEIDHERPVQLHELVIAETSESLTQA